MNGTTEPARGASPLPGGHLIQAQDLVVGYAGRALCAPFDMRVDPGEALFLVGANGAGKSTVLRTCLGLQAAVAGHVLVLGERADPGSALQRSGVARDLGEEAFFPSLSVREHLMLVCLGHGVGQVDGVVDAVLDELGLWGVADDLPDRLSSGQRRRLALASVLVRPRRLLVLDEPEHRLDHAARVFLAGRLAAEQEAGGALLVVSHDPALVEACASAVLLVGQEPQLLDVDQGVRAVEDDQ